MSRPFRLETLSLSSSITRWAIFFAYALRRRYGLIVAVHYGKGKSLGGSCTQYCLSRLRPDTRNPEKHLKAALFTERCKTVQVKAVLFIHSEIYSFALSLSLSLERIGRCIDGIPDSVAVNDRKIQINIRNYTV